MTENPALAFNLYNVLSSATPGSRRSRWNPTPEQLMSLKELYRCGIKTPTAQQIRQVTAMLRRFGRVEGKNVFYWFQNHRARERQKIRRELMAMSHSDCNEKQESSSVMQERMSMSHSSQSQCINAPDANPLDCDHCGREIQTLELFPLQSGNVKDVKLGFQIN